MLGDPADSGDRGQRMGLETTAVTSTRFTAPMQGSTLTSQVIRHIDGIIATHAKGTITIRFGEDTEQGRRWAQIDDTASHDIKPAMRTKPKLPIIADAEPLQPTDSKPTCFLCHDTKRIARAKSGSAMVMRFDLNPSSRLNTDHFEMVDCPMCSKDTTQ